MRLGAGKRPLFLGETGCPLAREKAHNAARGGWIKILSLELSTLIVFTFGGWLYLRLGYADLRANLPRSWLESQLASTALNASAARHAPPQPNPIAPTEANLLDGARLYRDKCADCHGRPDNPASDYGASFNPRVRSSFRRIPACPRTRSSIFIKNGVRRSAMPRRGGISWPIVRSGKLSLFSTTWTTFRPQCRRSPSAGGQ